MCILVSLAPTRGQKPQFETLRSKPYTFCDSRGKLNNPEAPYFGTAPRRKSPNPEFLDPKSEIQPVQTVKH